MRHRVSLIAVLCCCVASSAVAPEVGAQTAPPALPDGARYYAAFWPGAWYALKDGVRDSIPSFVVRPGPNAAAFEEEVDPERPRRGRPPRPFRIPTRAA